MSSGPAFSARNVVVFVIEALILHCGNAALEYA